MELPCNQQYGFDVLTNETYPLSYASHGMNLSVRLFGLPPYRLLGTSIRFCTRAGVIVKPCVERNYELQNIFQNPAREACIWSCGPAHNTSHNSTILHARLVN